MSDGGAQSRGDIIFFALFEPLFVQHKFKRKKYRCVLLPYLLSVSRNTLLGLAVLVPVMRPIVDATIRTAHIVLSPSILHSTLSSSITLALLPSRGVCQPSPRVLGVAVDLVSQLRLPSCCQGIVCALPPRCNEEMRIKRVCYGRYIFISGIKARRD